MVDFDNKKCSKCKIIKNRSFFYNDSQKKNGISSSCKQCKDEQNKSWKIKNPEKDRAIGRELRRRAIIKYPERYKSYNKTYDLRNRDARLLGARKRKLKNKFNITPEKYNQMLLDQKGKCKICDSENTGAKTFKHFPVDHCHKSGIVRGLLCNRCNSGLGNFRDDINNLNKAIKYLKEYSHG